MILNLVPEGADVLLKFSTNAVLKFRGSTKFSTTISTMTTALDLESSKILYQVL